MFTIADVCYCQCRIKMFVNAVHSKGMLHVSMIKAPAVMTTSTRLQRSRSAGASTPVTQAQSTAQCCLVASAGACDSSIKMIPSPVRAHEVDITCDQMLIICARPGIRTCSTADEMVHHDVPLATQGSMRCSQSSMRCSQSSMRCSQSSMTCKRSRLLSTHRLTLCVLLGKGKMQRWT